MPFHASSLAMVQSTPICSTSPACTYGLVRFRACAARIFCVSVMGWIMAALEMHRSAPPRNRRAIS